MKTLFASILYVFGYLMTVATYNAEIFSLSWFVYMFATVVLVATPSINYWEAVYEQHFNKNNYEQD
jgi:hypothetical protein